MLRGFWLAAGGLAVIVQVVLPLLVFSAQNVPDQLFAIAWGAAALYAVGAAITLFSAEREEQTRDFLILLPGRWLPMFVSKVVLALLSALSLAVALSLTGGILAGGRWPSQETMNEILAVAGVLIVEMTVWGLLFSLWMKQPLLAAIVAMAAASFGAQLAVASTSRFSQAFTSVAYSDAAPMRLLICLGVFLIDVWLASRWLVPAQGAWQGLFRRIGNTADASLARPAAAGTSVSRAVPLRPMLARLLWQTWRESWRTMLAAVPISLLLMVAIVATTWLSKSKEIAVLLCPLLLPALFGALVFRADQRRDHRQFLVAHAAWPRYVWFARHAVWLSTLILLGVLLQLGGILLAGFGLREQFQQALQYHNYGYGFQLSAWETAWHVKYAASTLWTITSLGWCAVISAYGVGQLCSMVLRREVLAGFLAMLLAAVLTSWGIVVGVWQLNPGWFVLSIGVVTMGATWLRAPDWIVDRNRPRTWLAPLLVIVVPLGAIMATLPQARLDQVAFLPSTQLYDYLREPLSDSLREVESSRSDARATATAYETLHSSLVPWEEATKDVQIDGKRFEEFEFLQLGLTIGPSGGAYGEYGAEEGGTAFTPEQAEISRRFSIAQSHAYVEANQHVIEEIEPLSRRPLVDNGSLFRASTQNNILADLVSLLYSDASRLIVNGQLETALERYLAMAHMHGQLLWYMRSDHARRGGREVLSGSFGYSILDWAQHSHQTSENVKAAITKLQAVFDNYPDPRVAVLADYRHVREILLDQQPPTFLKRKNPPAFDYLPFIQNMLPWERRRALMALDLLTTQNLNYVDAVQFMVEGGDIWDVTGARNRYVLREVLPFRYDDRDLLHLEPLCGGKWDDFVQMQYIASQSRSSFLVAEELSRCGDLTDYLVTWIDAQISQRGLLTQLALIAYHLDHGKYPETLDALVPDYLAWLPLDPYSRQPFEYRRDGLDLPLYRENVADPIPTGTPLLWSVGVSDFELLQHDVIDEVPMEIDTENSVDIPLHEMVYKFRPVSIFWRYQPNLVFTLPRIDAQVSQE